jgi:hypothetical protein
MTDQAPTPSRVGMFPPPGLLQDHKAARVFLTLVLTVAALLIFIAVSRGLAPAAGDHRTETPILVPHPAPGPFGS